MDTLLDKFTPFYTGFPKQFLTFLVEQVKSKLSCVRWEYTVTVKKFEKLLGKWSERG